MGVVRKKVYRLLQLITPYLHMKFQTNILSGSINKRSRNDRQPDQQSDRPSDIVVYRRSCRPQKLQIDHSEHYTDIIAGSDPSVGIFLNFF